MPQPDDLALELARVEAEVSELEAVLETRRELAARAAGLSAQLRRERLRLRQSEWTSEARVAALAGCSTLIIAGAFALDPDLGALSTAGTFALLIWEAVK
jgi:hypothetical protein